MKVDLNDTSSSAVAAALVRARIAAGSPAMGMVLTLIVVTDEARYYDAMRASRVISREHPARVLGVILRSRRGPSSLDAQVRIGNDSAGESVILRMSGELTQHAESVVLPLLLPDSPVVAWWPGSAPKVPALDPLGSLATRRITDAAAARTRHAALLRVARSYHPGDTDLAWTRLTPWRALLAAALDQAELVITGASVVAERGNPSADLLVAWLEARLDVPAEHSVSRGPGITEVRLHSTVGDVAVLRHDGRNGRFFVPGEAERAVALKRRSTAELLAEDLRRLDEDDVYAETVQRLLRREDRSSSGRSKTSGRTKPSVDGERPKDAKKTARRAPAKKAEATTTKAPTKKAAAAKTSAAKRTHTKADT
ncbi:glucose-6-phosphate dehydrogenase assembly protein OpcA [Mumia zhuanghuii]|uniref:OxPP cycle protein OpcA n=1 Tax=Mumia zhuanghuii TaxID=2585211 RepID=A0A5C4MBL7_9ACTN|nr:glucose-6-phosphate dehydrogenase assembly protein OpcA [Mumia zhuanghuii]TNC34211.1 OxPP cycle protein OpcA [Mumia zhuanghuii]TNC40344.1 OxPP cycle protein OpcA [Mumia zhuanghuii]